MQPHMPDRQCIVLYQQRGFYCSPLFPPLPLIWQMVSLSSGNFALGSRLQDVRPLSLKSKKGTNTTPGRTFSVMHAVALIDPALVEIFTSLWSCAASTSLPHRNYADRPPTTFEILINIEHSTKYFDRDWKLWSTILGSLSDLLIPS